MDYQKEIQLDIKKMDQRVLEVIAMMEQKKGCPDIVQELSIIRTAIDRAIGIIVAANVEHCVYNSKENDSSEVVKSALELIVKSR
ncbi:metal-sensing transcriptional repressor [Ectobacillus sp. sgz5001026]|uniref:metal-sensing transcriptional repressor n=1 Tax=Ectobacillus sp. sgz5001026 TaxID=3242473 RepID=UPI0036D20CC3